jgi:hypothetical protein
MEKNLRRSAQFFIALLINPKRAMFRNTFQGGYLSILYSLGSKPLQIWDKKTVDGQVKRVTDETIHSSVLEITGPNISTNYVTCPADPQKTLGIKLPYIVLIVKNMNTFFSFEIHVMDDKKVKRRLRCSNYQTATRTKPYICTMPLRLEEGWNVLQLNLAELCKKAYGSNYVETMRVQVRRYFSIFEGGNEKEMDNCKYPQS